LSLIVDAKKCFFKYNGKVDSLIINFKNIQVELGPIDNLEYPYFYNV